MLVAFFWPAETTSWLGVQAQVDFCADGGYSENKDSDMDDFCEL
jgi:hypothetical protein